jgi:hypothetical protein
MQLAEIESTPEKVIPSLWTRTKLIIKECRETFKQAGFKGVFRRYGWKAFAVFFCYYLVRDSILYILIPYLIARGFMN